MAKKVLKRIGDEIKKSKYFSLIVDSTPHTAHVDQLVLMIPYVLDTGKPCERFLKFLPSVGHKAQGMFDAITLELEKLNLSLEDCRGQSYDNASSGIYNGLLTQNSGTGTTCYVRPLCSSFIKFGGNLGRSIFYRGLSLLHVAGRSLQNLTRWSARADTCKSLRDSWDEVHKSFENNRKCHCGETYLAR
jgi:hypothetical protein